MANVNIADAVKLTGKSRSTVQRYIKSGKLSVGRDVSGNPLIDTSELLRVFGALGHDEQPKSEPKIQQDTRTISILEAQIKAALDREEWLKKQLEIEQERYKSLENRLLPAGEPEQKGFWARIFNK